MPFFALLLTKDGIKVDRWAGYCPHLPIDHGLRDVQATIKEDYIILDLDSCFQFLSITSLSIYSPATTAVITIIKAYRLTCAMAEGYSYFTVQRVGGGFDIGEDATGIQLRNTPEQFVIGLIVSAFMPEVYTESDEDDDTIDDELTILGQKRFFIIVKCNAKTVTAIPLYTQTDHGLDGMTGAQLYEHVAIHDHRAPPRTRSNKVRGLHAPLQTAVMWRSAHIDPTATAWLTYQYPLFYEEIKIVGRLEEESFCRMLNLMCLCQAKEPQMEGSTDTFSVSDNEEDDEEGSDEEVEEDSDTSHTEGFDSDLQDDDSMEVDADDEDASTSSSDSSGTLEAFQTPFVASSLFDTWEGIQ